MTTILGLGRPIIYSATDGLWGGTFFTGDYPLTKFMDTLETQIFGLIS